jgi:hypothetical protein
LERASKDAKQMNTQTSRRSPLSSLVRAVRRLVRPRYRTHIERSSTTLSGGGQKLRPIAEVLARTGREPSAQD